MRGRETKLEVSFFLLPLNCDGILCELLFFSIFNIGYHKKELSVIGEGCELGDKVTLKQCSIGKGCHIGAKSKLNNCIIMDHTIIGER